MAESPGGASQLAGHVVTIDSDDSSEAAPGDAAGKRLRVDASAGPLARAFGVMRGRPARTSYHSENPRSVLDYYDPSGASEPASEPASSSRKRRGAP